MLLKELYNYKLNEFKITGFKEKPEKLLAMLLLSERDNYEPISGVMGEFYEYYKIEINKKIAKVEKDFKITSEDIIKYSGGKSYIQDFEKTKIWYVFSEGFGVLLWGLMYNQEKTPEEIYVEYFNDNELIQINQQQKKLIRTKL